MITARTRKTQASRPEHVKEVSRDPSAKFVQDLATRPPTKDVASLKAASDVYDAQNERSDRRMPHDADA